MRYRIKAIAQGAARAGELVELELEAVNEAEARHLADARGLTVLALRATRQGGRRARFPLLLFNQEMLALLSAGIALTEAVDALAEKETRPAVRAVLDDIRQALREGRTLSSALEAAPHAFPDLYVAMIRAAERTSDLVPAVDRFIAYRQQVEALRGKLMSAAIYPALLVGVGSLVVLFLLGYVVPNFSHIYEDIGGDLPFLSRLLLQWGQFVEAHALAMGVGAVLAGAGLTVLLRQPATAAAAGRVLWRTPMIGERLRVFQLARFYRTLGMLLTGGIPVVTALGMVSGLLAPGLRSGLEAAIARIREGAGFAGTLADQGLATPVALRMLQVGERAGKLGEMLTRAAEFHEDDTARQVEWLTRLFGPLLMLFIGVAIGGIVVLMYLPIFQLAETVG